MAMLFPISLYFLLALRVYWPRWKSWGFAVILPAASVITIVASSSRGAVLALGALALLAVSRSRRKFKAIVGVALLLGAVYVLLPPEQKERFREIGEDDTSLTRKQYFWDGIEIMNNHPTLGIGYKNWLPYYGQHYGGYQVPHNIFIEAGAELGYAGLLGFIALIAATFVLNARTRRMAANLPDYGVFNAAMANAFDAALVAFAVAGYFVTILYYPFFWINLAMTVALYSVTRTGLWESSRASTGGNAFQAHGARVSRARSGTLPRHSTGHGT